MSRFKGAFDNLGERPKSVGVREVALEEIKIGDRFRKDLGDVGELAVSIEAIGLLHPVVLLPDMMLVAGGRRVEAFRQLGRNAIPARIVDNLQSAELVIQAERDENTARKPFTASEMAAIAQALLPQAEKEAAERRIAPLQKGTKKPGKDASAKPGKPGKALDQVAAVAGVSGVTLQKARKIIAKGDAQLIEAVDKGEISIDKAAKMVTEREVGNEIQVSEKPTKKKKAENEDPLGLMVPLKIGKRKFRLIVTAEDNEPVSQEDFIRILREKLRRIEKKDD